MLYRTLFHSIRDHLSHKEITLLVGPRQAGKTFLLRMMQDDMKKRSIPCVFLNLDIEADRTFFTSQQNLLQKLRLHLGERYGVVFIDEIQRKENAGIFLKGLYDMDLPYKFVVSGSGSLELKEKIHESLAGRKRIFELFPLSFEEFVDYKTKYRYKTNKQEFFSVEREKAQQLLEEYLMFGGYPRVVLAETLEEKHAEMREIYQSYLERDIQDLLGLKKLEEFVNLVKMIGAQLGSLVNYAGLSSQLRISYETLKKYLWYLEKTYILHKVSPYIGNVRREVTKSPLYYFVDVGLRNYVLGLFGVPVPTLLQGHVFENFIFQRIRDSVEFASTSIHFWRSQDHAEVDFVVKKGVVGIPVEVKYRMFNKPIISRSFRSFVDSHHPPYGYIIHLGDFFEQNIEQTCIYFLPFYADVRMNLIINPKF